MLTRGERDADRPEFQNTYLPQAYGTIATFNADNGTSYSAFSQVPAEAPGQSLFGVRSPPGRGPETMGRIKVTASNVELARRQHHWEKARWSP